MGASTTVKVDSQNTPVVPRVAHHLLRFERMLEFRRERMQAGTMSPGALGHFEHEIEAIEAGMLALRFHRATVEGLDSPFVVLRELLAAYEGEGAGEQRLEQAMQRAKAVLEDFGQAG
jgi:hypothetical protein